MIALAQHAGYALVILVAITAILLLGIRNDVERCREIFRPWNYFWAAVLLGGDGKHSFSAYCGTRRDWRCRLLEPVVDAMLVPGHCAEAARDEKLTP